MKNSTIVFLFLISNLFLQAQWDTVHFSYPEPALKYIDFLDESNGLAVGNLWYYYVTNDGGTSWQTISTLPGEYNDFELTPVGDAIIMESYGTFILFNIFSLEISVLHYSEDSYNLKTMEMIADSVILAGGFNGIYSFNLEGSTQIDTLWTFQSIGISSDPYIVSICRISDSILYAYGNYYTGGVLLKSLNNGINWDVVLQNTGIMGFLEAQNEDILFLSSWDGIYKSFDGGLNWSETILDPDTATLTFYDITFTDENNGYAVGGGSIFPEIRPTKIYKTIDGGDNWYLQYYSQHNALYSVCFVNDSLGFACGDFLTIMRTTNGGGVSVGLSHFEAKKFKISLYPNPARNEIHIRYQESDFLSDEALIKPVHYSLLIYDMFGRKMDELIIPKGLGVIQVDVSGYPSGIYITVLQNEQKAIEKKKFVVRH